MPALKSGKHSTYNGRVVDKESDDIVYFDDTHEYVDKASGSRGISVTTLIHRYTNPFDADFWSSYKAIESLMDLETWLVVKKSLLAKKKFDKRYLTKFGIDEDRFIEKKQEILDSYDVEREKSCEWGTKVHAALEQALYKKDPSIKSYEMGGSLNVYEGVYSKTLEDGIYPEYLISYKFKDMIICGQIDLLVVDNGEITIIDHKTCKKIDMKSYYNSGTKSNVMMKYPLNNLMDCNGKVYNMQLSLYAWMVQQNHPEYKVKRLALHWIDHDNKESFIELPYLEDDVKRMLRHYYKDVHVQAALNKLKSPIE